MTNIETAKYLNIGCGKVRYEDTINMDIADNKFTKVDIVGDVRSIPFPNNRFEGVILAHVLEHLSQKEHLHALMQIRRVLVEDGTLYIEVPDIMLACKYFIENYKGRRDYWYQCIYGRNDYGSDMHLSGITEQYLTDILFDCGFHNLRWLNLEKDEALIAVIAKKAKELPRDKL